MSLSAARERLYTSITNRFPYTAYHVLNNIAFHGFVFNKQRRYECVLCSDEFGSWGRNHRRACVQPEDLTNLIEHADSHLYCGESRLPFEQIAVLMPAPEVFCQFFNTGCWDQATYMSIALKKLAEDAGIRARSFADNPAAVASLHTQETVEDCVRRGLFYNGARRVIQCAFCSYTTNALGILHKENHADFTRCPRLLDCATRSSVSQDVEESVEAMEPHTAWRKEDVLAHLEQQLAQACAFPRTVSPLSNNGEDEMAMSDAALTGGGQTVANGGTPATIEAAVTRTETTAVTEAAAAYGETTVMSAEVEPSLQRPHLSTAGDGAPSWVRPPPSFASFYPSTVGHRPAIQDAASDHGGVGQRRLMERPYRATAAAIYYTGRESQSTRPACARRLTGVERARVGPIRGVATRAMTLTAATRQGLNLHQARAPRSSSPPSARAASLPLARNLSNVSASDTLPASMPNTCCAAQLIQPTGGGGDGDSNPNNDAAQVNIGNGMLGVWQRLAAKGYSSGQVLQLLAKRTDEPLDTYDDFKFFEHKVQGQDFITLGPTARRCIVCLRSPIAAAADPCGHMHYCQPCLKRLRYCSVCQRRVSRRLRVFSPYS